MFISHDKEKTIKPQNGTEYQQIGSSMQSSALSIIENMSDIIAYAHPKAMPDGTYKPVLTLRSEDNSVRCGCRFKYIAPEIDFSYNALVNALNAAIDAEAKATNGKYITTERAEFAAPKEYDYQALAEKIQNLIGDLMSANQSNAAKITSIIERYLGKGRKVSDCTPEQAELMDLIATDLEELIKG